MSANRGAGPRFVLSILPGAILLFGLFALVAAGIDRMTNGWGIAASLLGGLSLGFGILLLRAVLRDWRSLRAIRAHGYQAGMALTDGQVIAVDGVLETDAALEAPVSGRPCAGYWFRIHQRLRRSGGGAGDSRRAVTAAGIALCPFRLRAADRVFPVRALPEVDESMIWTGAGSAAAESCRALLESLMTSPQGPVEGIEERRLALRDGLAGPVDERVRRFAAAPAPDAVELEEACLPLGVPVCLLGSFDAAGAVLTAGRGLLGRVVHLYAGRREDVAERLAGEVRSYGRAGAVMVVLGAGLLSIPFLWAG